MSLVSTVAYQQPHWIYLHLYLLILELQDFQGAQDLHVHPSSHLAPGGKVVILNMNALSLYCVLKLFFHLHVSFFLLPFALASPIDQHFPEEEKVR